MNSLDNYLKEAAPVCESKQITVVPSAAGTSRSPHFDRRIEGHICEVCVEQAGEIIEEELYGNNSKQESITPLCCPKP